MKQRIGLPYALVDETLSWVSLHDWIRHVPFGEIRGAAAILFAHSLNEFGADADAQSFPKSGADGASQSFPNSRAGVASQSSRKSVLVSCVSG
jgi:hypothetical protein